MHNMYVCSNHATGQRPSCVYFTWDSPWDAPILGGIRRRTIVLLGSCSRNIHATQPAQTRTWACWQPRLLARVSTGEREYRVQTEPVPQIWGPHADTSFPIEPLGELVGGYSCRQTRTLALAAHYVSRTSEPYCFDKTKTVFR